MLLSQIFDQTPAERRAFMQEQGEPTHRATTTAQETRDMTNPRPPAAHTHRGKPRSPELDGHHEATKPHRTPTHRRNIPAVMPPRIHSILHLMRHDNA